MDIKRATIVGDMFALDIGEYIGTCGKCKNVFQIDPPVKVIYAAKDKEDKVLAGLDHIYACPHCQTHFNLVIITGKHPQDNGGLI